MCSSRFWEVSFRDLSRDIDGGFPQWPVRQRKSEFAMYGKNREQNAQFAETSGSPDEYSRNVYLKEDETALERWVATLEARVARLEAVAGLTMDEPDQSDAEHKKRPG